MISSKRSNKPCPSKTKSCQPPCMRSKVSFEAEANGQLNQTKVKNWNQPVAETASRANIKTKHQHHASSSISDLQFCRVLSSVVPKLNMQLISERIPSERQTKFGLTHAASTLLRDSSNPQMQIGTVSIWMINIGFLAQGNSPTVGQEVPQLGLSIKASVQHGQTGLGSTKPTNANQSLSPAATI